MSDTTSTQHRSLYNSRHNRFMGKGLFPKFRLSNQIPMNYKDALHRQAKIASLPLVERCRMIARTSESSMATGRHGGVAKVIEKSRLELTVESYIRNDGIERLEITLKHYNRVRCRMRSELIDDEPQRPHVERWRSGD